MSIFPVPVLPAYSAATIVDKYRCTHYSPCDCPSLPEHAQQALRRDEWSPIWLQLPINGEDPNKWIAKMMKKKRWLYMMKDIKDAFTHFIFNSKHVQAPWRMLVRLYCHDLPKELKDEKDRWSMKSWRDQPPKLLSVIRDCVKTDNAPPEITCGRLYVFSLVSSEINQAFVGDWLALVYIWATDCTWVETTDVRDLVSLNNLVGIRAWEWVDVVDAPVKTPYLFYELKQESNRGLNDTVFGGLPYTNYNTVPIHPEDPLPARLAGLRRLMNTEGRELASAHYD
ncbi:hypothetical protein V8C35DRAFT_324712 [Trichoderma chlorosporum]